MKVLNPATGEVVTQIRPHSLDEVQSMIEHMHANRHQWAQLSAYERSDKLMAWHDAILENKGMLAQAITTESGKILAEAKAEVDYAASFMRWFAEEAKRAYGDVIPSQVASDKILVIPQPIGVCAAITPWNFPLAMLTRKIAPALAAGCPMILKPAEATPISAQILESLARQVDIEDDVFAVVLSDNPQAVGELFCQHNAVKKISFTGSTATGRKLMSGAAENITKLSLELGGNAPFIVFADADISAAIEGVMSAKFRNAGQTCVAVNRVYLQQEIAASFTNQLTQVMQTLTVGNGRVEGVDVGPLINYSAKMKIRVLVLDALAQGAQLVLGAVPDESESLFVEPIIMTQVLPSMRIVQEEIFGPVVTIQSFTSEEEVLHMANDTHYGLAAYVYTNHLARTWRILEQLQYGMVGINTGMISTAAAPFGGIKQSGIGREGSKYGLQEYTELKYVMLSGLRRT